MLSLDLNQVILETARLRFIPISKEYREDIFREFTDEVTKYMSPPTPKEIAETDEFVAESIKKMEKKEEIVCVMINKNTEEFLGVCGIHQINTKTPEFGLWFKVSAQHQGFGKEAVKALKDWVDENIDYEYITYPVAVENVASRALPESLGGQCGEEFDVVNPNGKVLREMEYRIYK